MLRRQLANAVWIVVLLFAGVALAKADNAVCETPGQPIHEDGFVRIGGIEQWVTVTGERCSNPVILVLHGGPGNPMSPFADKVYAGWDKSFTLVQWDQRGAGKTFGKNRPSEDTPLTLAQMRDDGIELSRYLTQHLGKRKVILIGGSWSSVLAIHMIKAAPEMFTAYIGSAQIVSYRDNLAGTYARLLSLATAAGDTDSMGKLKTMGPPPWTDPRSFGAMRRIDRKYEAQASDAAPATWWTPSPGYATPDVQSDTEAGEDYSYINFVGFKGNGIFSTVDLPALGAQFEVPVFLFQGEANLLTLPEISRRYFDSLTAPRKQYQLLPRTGHDPNQRLLDAQLALLKTLEF